MPSDLVAAINDFRAEGFSRTNIPGVLQQMPLKADDPPKQLYEDPGPNEDRLFPGDYKHQYLDDNDCRECCDTASSVSLWTVEKAPAGSETSQRSTLEPSPR